MAQDMPTVEQVENDDMNYEAVTEAEVSALYAIPDQDMPPTPQPPPPPPLPPPALAAATTNSLHAPHLQQPTAYYYPNSHLQPPPQPYPPVLAPLLPPPNTSYYSHSFPRSEERCRYSRTVPGSSAFMRTVDFTFIVRASLSLE